jgi:hypothetical protein
MEDRLHIIFVDNKTVDGETIRRVMVCFEKKLEFTEASNIKDGV